MLTVSVRTDINESIARRLASASGRAEHAVAVQAEKDTQPFVPALTGSLTGRTAVKDNKIIYPGPYARYLYYGKLMVDPETGSAYAKKGASKILTNKDLVYTKTVHGSAQAHWCEASKAMNLKKWERVAAKAVIHNFGR